MLRLTVLLLGFICSVNCQSWASRAKVVNGDQYFWELMQETVYEVERKGWSNLRLLDVTQTLNERMYGWLVAGTVTYKNGFLTSIQKIDVEKIRSSVITRTVNNETQVIAQMTGILNFNDVEIGYDVVANLTDGVQHFTGAYVHILVPITCTIQKNMKTKEIATSARVENVSGGGNRKMRYLPATNVTEVISRTYITSSPMDGMDLFWGRNTIGPIMKDIATSNKLEFPTICFNC